MSKVTVTFIKKNNDSVLYLNTFDALSEGIALKIRNGGSVIFCESSLWELYSIPTIEVYSRSLRILAMYVTEQERIPIITMLRDTLRNWNSQFTVYPTDPQFTTRFDELYYQKHKVRMNSIGCLRVLQAELDKCNRRLTKSRHSFVNVLGSTLRSKEQQCT